VIRRFLGRLARDGAHLALEASKVVADGHGEGEELFEGLLGLLKGDGDAAWLKGHPGGEVLEFLGEDLKRGRDEQLGAFEAVLLQLPQNLRDVPAAAPLIVAVIARGEAPQVDNQGVAIGQAVRPDPLGNAGSEDLLGAAAADAEQKFQGRPVDERAGKGLELADGVV
jgi:hypothetical protein